MCEQQEWEWWQRGGRRRSRSSGSADATTYGAQCISSAPTRPLATARHRWAVSTSPSDWARSMSDVSTSRALSPSRSELAATNGCASSDSGSATAASTRAAASAHPIPAGRRCSARVSASATGKHAAIFAESSCGSCSGSMVRMSMTRDSRWLAASLLSILSAESHAGSSPTPSDPGSGPSNSITSESVAAAAAMSFASGMSPGLGGPDTARLRSSLDTSRRRPCSAVDGRPGWHGANAAALAASRT